MGNGCNGVLRNIKLFLLKNVLFNGAYRTTIPNFR